MALGANLSSEVGAPQATLIAVRPLLEKAILNWALSSLSKTEFIEPINKCDINWKWSPLFETEPQGGPPNQPAYINAALIIDGRIMEELVPSEEKALELLSIFLDLEKRFGRIRMKPQEKWGARCLDIDFLAWGDLQVRNHNLTLPHPRMIERSFVLLPLSAALTQGTKKPNQIPPQKNWIE